MIRTSNHIRALPGRGLFRGGAAAGDFEQRYRGGDCTTDELKLIAKTLSDLNAHAMHPHLSERERYC